MDAVNNIACCSVGRSSRRVGVAGQGPCDLLLVVESVTNEDVLYGYPMTGFRYKYIWDLFDSMGVSYYVTALKRCLANTKPNEECLSQLYRDIEALNPQIVLFAGGKDFLEAYIDPNSNFTECREVTHRLPGLPHRKYLATYDPSKVYTDAENLYRNFLADLVYAGQFAVAYKSEGKYRSVTINANQFSRIVDIWMADPAIEYVSFDTESNGLDPLLDNFLITSFSVAVNGSIGYNIFMHHPDLVIPEVDRQLIIAKAKELLTAKKLISHHAKHEHRMVKVIWGFVPNIKVDTMYLAYTLYLSYPGMMYGLKYLSGRFLQLPPWEETLSRFVMEFKRMQSWKDLNDERIEMIQRNLIDYSVTSDEIKRFFDIIKDPNHPMKSEENEVNDDPMYWLVPPRVMEQYAGMDAIAPFLLFQKLKDSVERDPGLKFTFDMLVKGSDSFSNVELHGIRLEGLDKWSEIYRGRSDELYKVLRSFPEVVALEQDIQSEFNPGSAKQLIKLLYEKFRFPVLETTKSGAASTSEDVIIALVKKYREEPENQRKVDFLLTLRDYKKLGKVQSAYWEGLKRFVHLGKSFDGITCKMLDIPKDTQIVCPGYTLHGTDTGRLSSQSPSIHTIPFHSDVKRVIVPIYQRKGGIYVMADQSQLEIRVLASVVEKYYGDSSLANAYREGRDIHRYNAGKIFGRPEEEIVDSERRFAKTISFSLLYGSSEKSVAESTGRTKDEVHDLFEQFFRAFPGVKAYIDATHKFVSTYGCVRTPFGRVKHIPAALNRDDRMNYFQALRQAQNSIIQSCGSDLSFRSINYMDDYFREHGMNSRTIAFIHDSIEIDAYPTEWFECYDLLLYSMKTYNEELDFIVCPLGIDVEFGTSMGDSVAVKSMIKNEDGSRTIKLKGYDYIINDIVEEAQYGYEVLKDETLESKEFVDVPGDLIARRAINLSFDNQTFIDQVREITLLPKSVSR